MNLREILHESALQSGKLKAESPIEIKGQSSSVKFKFRAGSIGSGEENFMLDVCNSDGHVIIEIHVDSGPSSQRKQGMESCKKLAEEIPDNLDITQIYKWATKKGYKVETEF